jgi:lipopolysaccharide biosynthesis regulator YciM
MNNIVGLILSAALIADTIANLLRLRGVEKAIRQQAEMMRRSDIEAEKRVDAASKVVEDIVHITVEAMLTAENKP